MTSDLTVVERPAADFPRVRRAEARNVAHGYAVRGWSGAYPELGTPWLWFSALEPAYTCGRALRMSGFLSGWDLKAAALETRYDRGRGQDVRTLYIDTAGVSGRSDDLLHAFADGVDRESSHWPRNGRVRHNAAT